MINETEIDGLGKGRRSRPATGDRKFANDGLDRFWQAKDVRKACVKTEIDGLGRLRTSGKSANDEVTNFGAG